MIKRKAGLHSQEYKAYVFCPSGKPSVAPFSWLLVNWISVTNSVDSAFLMGKGRVGWVYQGQLSFVAKEFAPKANLPSDTCTEDQTLRSATDFTFWGLYCIIMYAP